MIIVTAVGVQLVLGAGLLALGRWGVASHATLVSAALPQSERVRRQRAVVRGGRTCLVVGVALIAFATALAVAGVAGWVTT